MKTRLSKYFSLAFAPILGYFLATILYADDNTGPKYASSKTQEVIEKMVEAHGGLEKWRKAPTVSFHSHLKVNFGGGNWVPFWEEATVETNSRRMYAKLPNADKTFGRIAFDGEKAWSAGKLQGISQAPARFTAWRNFYLFNIPWLTQDGGVNFGKVERTELSLPQLEEKEYLSIRMTFDPKTGDTSKDWYTLYIDPLSHQIQAAEYNMTYASMMRGGGESSPPSIFVWEETEWVEGLLVPKKYTVYWSKDKSVAVKDGTITNWSFSKSFDESQMEMPVDGKPDASVPVKTDM